MKGVQKKGIWTPVNEGLPNADQEVLLTVADASGKLAVIEGVPDHEFGWYFDEALLIDKGVDDGEVIAWMPLPEPYKGLA